MQVLEWVHDFGNIFSKTKYEYMLDRKEWDHPINFENDLQLSKLGKLYPLDKWQSNSLNSWIDEKLCKEYIRPSTSNIAASFFFVKKYNGGLRLCMDY